MIISPIFTFAPIPLTDEQSPLAHAAALVRRRQADALPAGAKPRHRIDPQPENKVAETSLA